MKLTEIVAVRLSEEEVATLQDLARMEEMTVSCYVRTFLLPVLQRKRKPGLELASSSLVLKD